MTCKKGKCKKLCVDCLHYVQQNYNGFGCLTDLEHCEKQIETSIDCVTGEERTTYGDIREKNADGNCKDWTPKPNAKLRLALARYIAENRDDWAGRSNVKKELAEDLLRILDGGQSKYLKGIYAGDEPYDYEVVVKKDMIEHSINKYGYALEYEKEGTQYGQMSCDKLSDESYKKKKSWLNAVKRVFGFK